MKKTNASPSASPTACWTCDMKAVYLAFLAPLLFSASLIAQPQLTPQAQASLMTVAPGTELYSTFGHSALRIHDEALQVDRIYNYGTFDFDQPNFYLNFCRGKLLYMLDREPYASFVRGNLLERREMKEQVLALSPEQVQSLFNYLENNALPANRNYKYDFFYDNCATRIRDAVETVLERDWEVDSSSLASGTTMRQLLRPYLKPHPWTQFGIDLVLGMPTDREATARTFVFLPDHLSDAFGGAQLSNGAALVARTKALPADAPYPSSSLPILPMPAVLLFTLLGLLSLLHPIAERVFDAVFWTLIGVAGVIIFLLWFFTDHQATKGNLNIFWAQPWHILAFLFQKGKVARYFYLVSFALAALFILLWPFLPQEFPWEAGPLAALVAFKSMRYYRKAL